MERLLAASLPAVISGLRGWMGHWASVAPRGVSPPFALGYLRGNIRPGDASGIALRTVFASLTAFETVTLTELAHETGRAIESKIEPPDAWSDPAQFRVGMALIGIIVRATGWFQTERDPRHRFATDSERRRRRIAGAPVALVMKRDIIEWAGGELAASAGTPPLPVPDLMPTPKGDMKRPAGRTFCQRHTSRSQPNTTQGNHYVRR